MPNVKCIISGHNKSIINKELNTMTDQTGDQCNCRNKDVCPVQNKCLTTNVYQATVTRTLSKFVILKHSGLEILHLEHFVAFFSGIYMLRSSFVKIFQQNMNLNQRNLGGYPST